MMKSFLILIFRLILSLALLSCLCVDEKGDIEMKERELETIGWREWVKLPDLAIKKIKVKVDTGARTSSLHAYDVKIIKKGRYDYATFKVHPEQNDNKKFVRCEARVIDYRKIKSSNGSIEKRPIIETTIELLDQEWTIELSLTNRDEMGFRMLLGRASIKNKFLVDPGKSFYGKKPGGKK